MNFIQEFFQFAKQRKKLWLIPLMLVLLALSVLIVFIPNSALAPYIYTLF